MSIERNDLTFEEWQALMAVHQGESFRLSKTMRARLIFLDLIDGQSVPKVSRRGRALIKSTMDEIADHLSTRKGPLRWKP